MMQKNIQVQWVGKAIHGLGFRAVSSFSSVWDILPFSFVPESWATLQLCVDAPLYIVKLQFCWHIEAITLQKSNFIKCALDS